MNAFELARLPRIALMAECMLASKLVMAADHAAANRMARMSREALVTRILREREAPPGPLPKRAPGASLGRADGHCPAIVSADVAGGDQRRAC